MLLFQEKADITRTVDYFVNVQLKSKTFVMAAVLCSVATQPLTWPTALNKSDRYHLTAGAEEGKGEEE